MGCVQQNTRRQNNLRGLGAAAHLSVLRASPLRFQGAPAAPLYSNGSRPLIPKENSNRRPTCSDPRVVESKFQLQRVCLPYSIGRKWAIRRLDFLSKEAVPGELLSAKLARGPLSIEEALRYAIEIGAALHKIHARGLVHGALSPFCIALAADGARILEGTPSPEDRAAYRAPEQLRGEEPDVRSDVFAYGALVYEIASGKRAFPGMGEELAQGILTQSPVPLSSDSPISAALEAVIAGCIEKDPALRRQRVQNAVTELKLVAGALPRTGEVHSRKKVRPVPSPPPNPAPGEPALAVPRLVAGADAARSAMAPYWAEGRNAIYGLRLRRRVWVIGAAVLALAATSVAGVMFLQRRPAPAVLKFAVFQPENTSYPGMSSVSPDGRYLTFSAVGPEGKRMLWLRPLDALHATLIQGSEGASSPFWSPDSQSIAFFGGRFLMKVRITGGTPEIICQAEAEPGGGSWNRDGIIVFAPSLSDGFYRVAASGGKPQQWLKLDESKSERADLWPQFLPDGKHFVFYQQTDLAETSGVYVGSIERPEYYRLFTSQTNAVYSAASPDSPTSGYLLYINERNLMAQQFNTSRLEIAAEPDHAGERNRRGKQSCAGAHLGLHYRCAGLPGRGTANPAVGLDGSGRQADGRRG